MSRVELPVWQCSCGAVLVEAHSRECPWCLVARLRAALRRAGQGYRNAVELGYLRGDAADSVEEYAAEIDAALGEERGGT